MEECGHGDDGGGEPGQLHLYEAEQVHEFSAVQDHAAELADVSCGDVECVGDDGVGGEDSGSVYGTQYGRRRSAGNEHYDYELVDFKRRR